MAVIENVKKKLGNKWVRTCNKTKTKERHISIAEKKKRKLSLCVAYVACLLAENRLPISI